MRFRLRTLLTAMALGPPVLAAAWWAWPKIAETKQDRAIADFEKLIALINSTVPPDTWDQLGGPRSISAFQTGCPVVVSDEGYPDGPDPCGRSYFLGPYSPDADNGFSLGSENEPTIAPSPDKDPFAPEQQRQ